MSGIDVVQKDAKRTAKTIAGDALLMMLMRNGWSDGTVQRTDCAAGGWPLQKKMKLDRAQTESASSCFNRLILV